MYIDANFLAIVTKIYMYKKFDGITGRPCGICSVIGVAFAKIHSARFPSRQQALPSLLSSQPEKHKIKNIF